MSILRSFLAVVGGLTVGMLAIMAVQGVSMAIYPMPDGLSMDDRPALLEWMRSLTVGAFLLVLGSYVAGASVGGAFSALVASTHRVLHAGVIGMFVLLGTIANFLEFPEVHPNWMVITSCAQPIPVSLAAGWLIARLRRGHDVAEAPSNGS